MRQADLTCDIKKEARALWVSLLGSTRLWCLPCESQTLSIVGCVNSGGTVTESPRVKAANGEVKTAAVDCMTAICNCTGNRHEQINMQQREHSSDKVRSRSFCPTEQDGPNFLLRPSGLLLELRPKRRANQNQRCTGAAPTVTMQIGQGLGAIPALRRPGGLVPQRMVLSARRILVIVLHTHDDRQAFKLWNCIGN